MRARGIGALLLAVPLSASVAAGPALSASAAAAPPYYNGADAAGAVLVGDGAFVKVLKEELRFTLAEFPSFDGTGGYVGKCKETVTLQNTGDTPAVLDFALPLPQPDYDVPAIDASSFCSIEVGGEAVSAVSRYTSIEGGQFDVDEGLSRLSTAGRDFYRDDLPVTAYTYRAEVTPSSDRGSYGDYVNFALSFHASAERTRVVSPEPYSFGIKDGKARLTYGFVCNESGPVRFTVCVLGEDVEEIATEVFRYDDNNAASPAEAAIALESKSTTTFSEFALGFRKEERSGVSDGDWKRAFADAVEGCRSPKTCWSDFVPDRLNGEWSLVQWLTYSLTVPAGGTCVYSVTVPVYPAVDGGSAQTLYSYSYLLSPAQKWAGFGELVVDVDTPFFLSDGSLDFVKREGGYTLTRERLPLGELTFTLTEEERRDVGGQWLYNGENGALITAVVILCVMAVIAAVVCVLLTVHAKKKKRSREEEERRLLQTRPQEGKIDLPDETPPPEEK